jgi:cell division protease FtsH
MLKERYRDVDWRHVAYHEAGHAVVALRLGYEVGKVSIVPRQGVLGRAKVLPQSPSPDDIRIDLAGPLAEALVNPFDEKIQLGSRSDWRNIRRSTREFVALGFINGREWDILIDELLRETRALVRRDRKAIASVAAALLERKTLTGDDIKRIVEEVR